MTLYGGIEAGGTKFVCMIASGPEQIQAEARFPTTTPEETIARAVDFFRSRSASLPIAALGIASFGPLDLDPASATYGRISATPKPGWSGADLRGRLEADLAVPAAIDTDVNGAALAEYRWGAARGADPCLYLTIGTGIGGGAIVNGRPVHGLVHPEMGHMRLPHDLQQDPFAGVCPFHGDCFEGLASGTALEKRWGRRAETFEPDHPAWDLEANYIAMGLMNLVLALSPRRIILGGGVMQNDFLFGKVRRMTRELLNGYIQSPAVLNNIHELIIPPGLGNRSGALGAVALAETALQP